MASVGHHHHHHRHPPPNYVNPQTRPPWVQATCIIYMILGIGTLLLRLYTRVRFGHRVWMDDVLAVSGTAFAMSAYIVMLVMEDCYGYNRHSWDIPPAMYRTALRLNWVYSELFVQAACQAKLSLLLFCWRLVGRGFSRAHSLLVVGLMIIVILCEVVYLTVSLLLCRPLKAVWDPHPNYPHTCLHVVYFMLSAGIINTSTDFACTLLPILFVLRLQMPLRQRFAVASMFLIGFSANVASGLRIYYAYQQDVSGGDMWNHMQPSIASNSEIGLGLVCINAPVIRPFLTHLFSRRSRYSRIYAADPAYGAHVSGYWFGRTTPGLNYASETCNTCNTENGEGTVRSGKLAISVLDGETELEAAAANAHSWRARVMELGTIRDARPHLEADVDAAVDGDIGALGGNGSLWL